MSEKRRALGRGLAALNPARTSTGRPRQMPMVGPVGLEPTTYGVKVRSSAIELEAPDRQPRRERRQSRPQG